MDGIWGYTYDEILQAVKDSTNIASVLKRLGIASGGKSCRKIKKYISINKISTKHFVKSPIFKYILKTINDKDLFVENSKHSPATAKRRYRKLYPPVKCAWCSVGGIWNDKPLKLQLDHIDGNPKNQQLDNFRYLCPNCHSQTDTYGFKDRNRWSDGVKLKKKPKKANKIDMRKANWDDVVATYSELKNYTQTGKIYGITGNGVKKIIENHSKINP